MGFRSNIMPTPVSLYRKAAKRIFGANDSEVLHYIVETVNDTGEWAPRSLGIIYLEPHGGFN